MKKFGVLFGVLFGFAGIMSASGQALFERGETNAGNLGLSITNVGVIGKADVRNNPDAGVSMRFPINTGTEHLFEAGLWMGAFVDGGLRVSTAAVTNPSGYSRGQSGYEFTPDGPIRFEGPQTGLGVSDQDLITTFTDRNLIIPGTTTQIAGHSDPLYAYVEQTSYNWAFPFTENFSILKLSITNRSDEYGPTGGFAWDSLYVGQYADIVVRNVFTAQDQGSAFFNKNGLGYLDSRYTTYAFDAGSNDASSINTYGGITILGSEITHPESGQTVFYHPANPTFDPSHPEHNRVSSLPSPIVDPSYWLFSAGTGVYQGPPRGSAGDQQRYDRMSSLFPLEEVRPNSPDGRTIREELRTDGQDSQGNYISMIATGPFRRVEPGETIHIYFGVIAAEKTEPFVSGIAGKAVDDEESRQLFEDSIDSMYRVFLGEDADSTGIYSAEKDINGNGRLDRFLFPTPPDAPKLRIELSAGTATLYWDRSAESSQDPVTNELDFEGYKVYRTDLGDDLNPTPRLIREWDRRGNDVGFNTGLEDILLDEAVTFPGDDTEYWYRFEIDGLLSGWQYQFSVTSFDFGSQIFELGPLETSPNVNAVRVFPGTPANVNFSDSGEEFEVGVYPNPYRINAAWDGTTDQTRKLMFTNLPPRAEIRVYTLSGDIVAEAEHTSDSIGDIQWYNQFSTETRILPGGEFAFDLLSNANQNLTTGLYLFSVKNLESGHVQTGKFAVIK